MDLANEPVADQLAAQTVILHRTPLRSGLEHAFVLPCRLDHQAAFANGQSQGLFAVDVFSRLAGLDAGQGVPMVGRGDDHRIDVPGVQQLAVVGMSTAFSRQRGRFRSRAIDVGHGHDPAGRRQAHQLVAAAADPDVRDPDAIAGSRIA
jgi:hypothetical protein